MTLSNQTLINLIKAYGNDLDLAAKDLERGRKDREYRADRSKKQALLMKAVKNDPRFADLQKDAVGKQVSKKTA